MREFCPGVGPRVWLVGIRSSVVALSISESSCKKGKEGKEEKEERKKSDSNLWSSRQIHADRYPSENIKGSSIHLPFQFSKMLTLSQMMTV